MTPLEYVLQRKIVAIVRGLSPEYLVRLGHAFEEGGIGLMEVTYNQKAPETWKDTAAGIEAVEKEFGDRVLVGAGTVITLEQVAMTYNAGGHYLVTPTTQPDIIRAGKALGLGLYPGALSPSEILSAYEAGADAVKVFPVSSLGPGYIKAVRAPLSHIPLMAVGGVNEKNAADYMKAGCVGLGVGGNLVNKEWIENGEWGKITALAKEFMKAVTEE
ncbi:MAG: bifunctional 4-hydroxy-2-oxoglutarate aldolase/2-dehydro-3-deoxy-phosphogluconate aldolase [Anaerolineaceae bacterium]|nr:bifunctional 4-hydroxy-2-oxoglutarate aldolase/2-dehydro-3-deoxy-phosphogluconate aldolase [Oscillospiraceae bacterium]MBQ6479745.1 bifunctional 4-hydroxy-2-oxoglutarate aldolase/2-dehydro-3-deoxy-phosphogluconate aldolase [Anaerolineaceae bacterium]